MGRILLIIVLLILLGAGGGILALGAFPPLPKIQSVERVLPNDHFGKAP